MVTCTVSSKFKAKDQTNLNPTLTKSGYYHKYLNNVTNSSSIIWYEYCRILRAVAGHIWYPDLRRKAVKRENLEVRV